MHASFTYSWTAQEPTGDDGADRISCVYQPYQIRIYFLYGRHVSSDVDVVE